MVNENYFDKAIKEIKELQERISSSEKELSIPDDEMSFMFEDNTQTHHQRCAEYRIMEEQFLQRNRQKIVELQNELKGMCSFDSSKSLEYISYILTNIENKDYEVIRENGACIIRPIGNINPSDVISFRESEKIDLFSADFMDKSSDSAKRYPYLENIIMDLIYYKTNIFNSYLCDEQIFNYMYMVFPIDYPQFLDENIRSNIVEELKPIVRDLARDLVRDITDNSNDFSSIYNYRLPLEEGQKLFEALKNGKYNSLANNDYWFGDNLSPKVLTRWNSERSNLEREGQTCSDISIENYKVFAAIDDLIGHLEVVNKQGSYDTNYIDRPQTPTTVEEQVIINKLLKDTLKRNYDWRQSRDVVRNFNRLSIYNNYEFPHNIDEIVKAFNPIVNTYFDKIDGTIDLKSDLAEIEKRALEMAKNINDESLPKLFIGESKDSIDEYLRRMILSQFDIPKLVRNSRGGTFFEKLELVKQELSDSTNMSPEVSAILFSDHSNNEQLVDLARGTLLSLCYDQKIDNILRVCIEIQKSLNCWNGTVGQNDINTLKLPNGDVLCSTYSDDIEPQYMRFQKEYEHYYNGNNDLEFVEGCSELFGNVLISQIFREGNKRTAKCLFNALLVSRSIVPPIADLNENERALWDEFTDGRFDRFPNPKAQLLMETIDVNKRMKTSNFSAPVNICLDAVNRSEFNKSHY